MNGIRQLHLEAMELAEGAYLKNLQGNLEKAQELFLKAYQLEAKAANLAIKENAGEPSRSVLLRSAAALALQGREFREAEKMISVGLAGDPPFEIAEELRNLLEQVNFDRHLDLKGISLSESELQLSVAGKIVGYGMALSEEILDRVNNFQKLIYRTAERITLRDFRERGQPDKSIKNKYELFLSAPRAASFAITMKLGRPSEQLTFPEIEDSTEILDEILENLKLINNSHEKEARMNFPDEAYFRNFLALAKNIAPDGNEVNLVGFTTIRKGKEKRLELTRSKKKISAILKSEGGRNITREPSKLRILGSLRWADAIDDEKGRIKLLDQEGKLHTIIVPAGMMADIVKPLWEDIVVVSGTTKKIGKGTFIELEDIEIAKDK